jgi:hypothetical protein
VGQYTKKDKEHETSDSTESAQIRKVASAKKANLQMAVDEQTN